MKTMQKISAVLVFLVAMGCEGAEKAPASAEKEKAPATEKADKASKEEKVAEKEPEKEALPPKVAKAVKVATAIEAKPEDADQVLEDNGDDAGRSRCPDVRDRSGRRVVGGLSGRAGRLRQGGAAESPLRGPEARGAGPGYSVLLPLFLFGEGTGTIHRIDRTIRRRVVAGDCSSFIVTVGGRIFRAPLTPESRLK